MKVITIANYTHGKDNYYKMFLAWLAHNHQYMSECEIVLAYAWEDRNELFSDHCQNFLKNYDNVTIKKLKSTPFPIPRRPRLTFTPFIRNYMMSVWYEEAPYVSIDTDLFLFKPIKEFYKHLDDNPFVGTGHGGYQRKQENHLNGGLYGVGDSNFFDVDAIYDYMTSKFPEGSNGSSPGDISWRQQHAVNEWIAHKNYNPFVFEEHYFWNWWGRFCKFNRDSSGNYDVTNERDEQVYGAHFFGGKKVWRTPNGKDAFWEPTIQKIRDMGTEV
jgi:hypothetical protein